jgi:hypothetical protein
VRYLALFPFSSSRVLSLSSYILSRLSMIVGSSVGGLTYLHLHLYPHMTNPTDRLFLSILSQFYGRGCRVGAFELCCFLFHDIHLALKTSVIYNSTTDSLALFPFSSSRVLSLSGYILSRLSMIAGSSVGGLTYLHLHLYPHMTNPTDHCSFPYLANFMAIVVVGLALSNSVASCSVIYILHSKLL